MPSNTRTTKSLLQKRTFIQTLLFVICCLSTNFVFAAKPQVRLVSPPGLQRGTSAEIDLTGTRIGDAKQLLFYTPGMEATSITKVDDNKIKVMVTSAADAACELHAFRVITATGISNLRYLGVSPFPTVTEAEPNNDFKVPQVIPMGSTVNGVVQTEDVDYYAVDVSKGTLITVELEGLRHAYLNNFFDPFVAILDSNRFELARSDDASLLQQDCVCSVEAPEDGRYWIEVRESSFGGTNESLYRLHVGSFARPLAIIPSGGQPGKPIETTVIDALGKAWQQTLTLPAANASRHGVWAARDGHELPSPNLIRVNDMENVVETEPNLDYKTLPVHDKFPVAFNGSLQVPGDRDFFVFSAKKDQQLDIRVYGRSILRSPIDAVINVLKMDGKNVVGADDTGGPDSTVAFKAPEDGNYAISVRDHLENGGPHYSYRVEVTPQSPAVEVTVAEQERYVSQTVEVPRGGRMAFEVNLARKAISGEGRVVIPDLPEGMTQSEATVPADLNSVSVILHAKDDAANTGKLVDLTASVSANPETKVVGHLSQRTQIIRGQNNVDVWGHVADRLTVAIVDPIPFDIVVEQPKVPIVRNGTLPLKVRAVRKDGFNKPIQLRLLSKPPGIAASGSISIAGDKNEAEIPLTANSGAAMKAWPITVIASSDSGFGTVQIASEFIMLEVADKLFDFKFNKTMVEQGKPAKIAVEVALKRPAEGTVEVELLGIPPGTTVSAPKQTVTGETAQLVYQMDVAADAKPGSHKTIVCRGTVSNDKGVISQTNGTIEVQIDVPLPAPAAKPVTVAAAAPPAQAAPAVEKPMTRIEQLRKLREENK